MTLHGNGKGGDNGVFYEINAAGKYKVLYRFCVQQDCTAFGEEPPFGLTYFGAERGLPYDGQSPLFGILSGSPSQMGVLFQFVRDKGKGKFRFAPLTGIASGEFLENLVTSPSGNDFFVQASGAADAIYQVTLNGIDAPTVKQVFTFCKSCDEGREPQALTIDGAGNLFGATIANAKNKHGAAWELTATDFHDSAIHAFCGQADCADGAGITPFSMGQVDSTGMVFGTTENGGGNDGVADGGGTIFEIGTDGSFNKIYSFCAQTGCADGAEPFTGLTPDGAGNYFGTTSGGGTHNSGTVYRLTP